MGHWLRAERSRCGSPNRSGRWATSREMNVPALCCPRGGAFQWSPLSSSPILPQRLVEGAQDAWVDVALQSFPHEIGKLFVLSAAPASLTREQLMGASVRPMPGAGLVQGQGRPRPHVDAVAIGERDRQVVGDGVAALVQERPVGGAGVD